MNNNENAQMSNFDVILRKCLIMAAMGLLTQIVAAFILTFILGYLPSAQQSYSESLAPLLEITSTVIFATVFFAPIAEEIVFRFMILEGVGKFLPFFVANIIQAGLFGLYHRQLVQGIYAFIIGLFIGYLKKINGNFFYGILYHMALNALGLFIDVLIPESTPVVIKGIVFVVSAIGLILLTIRLKKYEDRKCTVG